MSDRPGAVEAVRQLEGLEGVALARQALMISSYPDQCVSDALFKVLLEEEDLQLWAVVLTTFLPLRFVDLDRKLAEVGIGAWSDVQMYVLCKLTYKGRLMSVAENVQEIFESGSWIARLGACHYMLTYEGHDSAVEFLRELSGQLDLLVYMDAMPPIDCAELTGSQKLAKYIAGLLEDFGYPA